jgi:hypothetical protein
VKSLPTTTADLRVRLSPVRTWLALSVAGLAISLVRAALYGVSDLPITSAATPFIAATVLGAAYAAVVFGWRALRRLYVR